MFRGQARAGWPVIPKAPVIDFRSYDPTKIQFSDGRHTFIALEQLNYSCIEVCIASM